MVVGPVFESLIRLHSHTIRLFTGMTTAFCNLTHTCTFLAMFTRSVFGIDNPIYLQLWFSKCHVHTATYSNISNTFCMNVQWKSSLYTLPVTIATVDKVISKMVTAIKLKVLSLSDTWVQAASSSVKSSLTDSCNIWVERSAERKTAEVALEKKNWLDLKLSGDTANFSINVSYQNPTWKHEKHSRHAFVQQRISLSQEISCVSPNSF